MKIDHAQFTSISSGEQDAKEFGINFDATMAYALMSGIAKDKIRYPVREVGTNAYDANPKVPFDVKLPSVLDPTFRFRDFGLGLSHDHIMSIYTTFGGSSKRHTNDQIGGLGYGSKSPFAYLISRGSGAASFTVISYHDGQAHTYVMALSASGMPTVRYFGAQPSAEPSGIEVSFAVAKQDVQLFIDAAKEIYWHFPVRPTGIDFTQSSIVAQGDNWTLYDSNAPFYSPHVRMGCVAYPINFEAMRMNQWPWRDVPIVFDAPIGSLSFTTSREDLGYDTQTIAQITTLLKAYEVDYAPKVQALIDPARNYLEACTTYHRLLNSHPGVEWLNGQKLISYKGKRLHSKFSYDRRDISLMKCIHASQVVFVADDLSSTRDSHWNLFPEFFQDIKAVVYSTTRDRITKRLEMLDPPKPFLWVRFSPKLTIDDVVHKLGIEEDFTPLNLADVKLPKRVKGDPTVKLRKTHYLFGNCAETSEMIDRNQGGLYVIFGAKSSYRRTTLRKDRFRPSRYTMSQISGYDIKNMITTLRSANLLPEDQRIYVFKDDEEIGNNWVSLGDYVEKHVGSLIDLADVSQFTSSSLPYDLQKWAHTPKNFDVSITPPDIVAFSQKIIDFMNKKSNTKTDDQSKLMDIFLALVPTDVKETGFKKFVAELEEELEALNNKYPLLHMITNHWSTYSSDKLQEFHHYCQLLSNQK